MKRLYILCLLVVFVTGCSVVMATQQPSKRDLSVLSKGVDRSRVVSELGSPLTTDVKDGKRTDVFSVRQGYSTGAKAGRAVFHAVADVCTLGLWEVVGTPVEAVASGTDVKVGVCYDTNDRVTEIITYTGKEKVDAATVSVAEKVNQDKGEEGEKQAQQK
jgi:outer membrane protein assembly factor BamE (lipoprotein component of BamABCDE complex)